MVLVNHNFISTDRVQPRHTYLLIIESFHMLTEYSRYADIEDCRVDPNPARKLVEGLILQGFCTVLIVSDKYMAPLS